MAIEHTVSSRVGWLSVCLSAGCVCLSLLFGRYQARLILFTDGCSYWSPTWRRSVVDMVTA